MATIIESATAMTDAEVTTGTEMRYKVFGADHPDVAAIASDPENPTLAERLFVRVGIVVHRDDGGASEKRWSEWKNVNATNYPTLVLADHRSDLKTIHDAEKALMGV